MAEIMVPEANGVGHTDLAEAAVSEPSANGAVAAEQATERPEEQRRGIYFVRVPRPHFDDSQIKKFDTQLSACFTKLKNINSKAQVKRGEANELRKQLAVARSLRNGSSPEFDEKMTRLKQLREMRKAILDKISDFKQGRAGLECRTEAELEEKIAELEHSIQHDGLTLQAEKQTVQKISKLKAQRGKIREVQGQQESLVQLEAEAKKIKAVIDEVDSEVNILRGERDQAKDIIDDLQEKLRVVTAALNEYDVERQDIESTKRELQEQLKAMREEIDNHMFEWRDNRKLSLQLRDLVAEGKVDEAAAIAEQQVETYLKKLLADTTYRCDYTKLWSEQRKYLVSELLPESGAGALDAKAAGKGAAAGKAGGKKGVVTAAAALVPQGAAKAQALIAAALQEANDAIAAKRLAEPQQQQQRELEGGSTEEAEEQPTTADAPTEPAMRVVPGAFDELTAPSKAPKAPKLSFDHARMLAEVPEVPDYEYIMPVAAPKQAGEQLSAAELKAKVREEQRQKAQEAEQRKKRRQEQLAKKAAASAAAKQKAAAEQQAATAAASNHHVRTAAGRAAALAAKAAKEEVDGSSGTDGEGETATSAAAAAAIADTNLAVEGTVSKAGKSGKEVRARGNKHLPAKAMQHAAASKKPLAKKPPKVVKWHQQYSVELAIAGVALLMLVLLILFLTTK